jgi:hypothetical protein
MRRAIRIGNRSGDVEGRFGHNRETGHSSAKFYGRENPGHGAFQALAINPKAEGQASGPCGKLPDKKCGTGGQGTRYSRRNGFPELKPPKPA